MRSKTNELKDKCMETSRWLIVSVILAIVLIAALAIKCTP